MYLFFSFFFCLSSSISYYRSSFKKIMTKPSFLSNFIYENNYETKQLNNDIKDNNNTFNITQIQINRFIENLKLKEFDQCNEIENWDSGEIEWEV
jgi:hypothetical protein